MEGPKYGTSSLAVTVTWQTIIYIEIIIHDSSVLEVEKSLYGNSNESLLKHTKA